MGRTRRTKIKVHGCSAKTDWGDSKLIFRDYRNDEQIEVQLSITAPWAVKAIRHALSEIVKNWKDSVQDL